MIRTDKIDQSYLFLQFIQFDVVEESDKNPAHSSSSYMASIGKANFSAVTY